MKNQVADYLEYYCSMKNPKFAVLVKGAWGSGKTHQVKAAFDAMAAKRHYRADPLEPDNPIWISLYGIDATHSLDAAVVAASDKSAHLGIGGMRMVGDLARGVGGVFAAGAIVSELAGPILRRSLAGNNHRVLVFDDLERCVMPLDQSLGAINHYVETLGFKAIIIAHEDKIINEMAMRKEKLIGQTLTVFPDFQNASKHFINEIENAEARSFLFTYEAEMSDAFAKCNIFSLRILRHVFFDIARLYDCLNKDQVQKSTAMRLLIKKVALLSGLFREGALTSTDFDQFSEEEMYAGMGFRGDQNNDERQGPLSRLDLAMKRLEAGGAFNNLRSMSDEMIKAIVVEARYDKDEIQRSLCESGLFGDALEGRSWWRVWHRQQRSDAEVEQDVVDFELDFQNREFVQMEDILHLFSLRLALAVEQVFITKTISEVAKECESYISDLLASGTLQPAKRHGRDDQFLSNTGSYGLGYWLGRQEEPAHKSFSDLFALLAEARQISLRRSYAPIVAEVLRLLRLNSQDAIDDIAKILSFDGPNSTLPIFSESDAKITFDALSKLDGALLFDLAKLLSLRYHGVQLDNGLDPEIPWIDGLLDLAKAEAKNQDQTKLKRWRWDTFVQRINTKDIARRKAILATECPPNDKSL